MMKSLSPAIFCLAFTACSGTFVHPDLKEDVKVLRRQWTLPTRLEGEVLAGDRGFEYSNGVLFENTLIFGAQTQGLLSIYTKSAQLRWVLPIQNGVSGPIALENKLLFFTAGDGHLYCVQAETGKVVWRYSLRNTISSLPTFAQGKLFVTTPDDTVYAFDAQTGQWLWHYRRRTAAVATIHGASAPLVDGQDVIVGLSDGFVVVLNAQDGKLKWEKKLHEGRKFTDIDAHPVLEAGVIYLPSYDGSLYALRRTDGQVIWKFDSGGSRQVFLEENRLFLPSSDGFVYALSKQNGKVLWKFELDEGIPTQLAVTHDRLIFGSSHRYLYAVDKLSGKGLYRMNVGYDSGFSGAPAYDVNTRRVYFLSGAGHLYAFSL